MIRLAGVLFFAAALALAQLESPRLGCFLDQTGLLRSVYGVRGNFVLGPVLESGVVSAACSERFAVVKTEQALELLDLGAGLNQHWVAPDGPALFGLSQDGAPALVYFSRTSEWFRLAGGELVPLALDFAAADASALAIAQPDTNRMAAVIQKDARLWLLKARLADGQLEQQTELVGVSAPLLLRPDGAILFARETELVLRTSDGAERRTPLPARPAVLHPMGSGWVHLGLAEPDGHLALVMLGDREELYRLPEAPR